MSGTSRDQLMRVLDGEGKLLAEVNKYTHEDGSHNHVLNRGPVKLPCLFWLCDAQWLVSLIEGTWSLRAQHIELSKQSAQDLGGYTSSSSTW